MPDNQDVTTNAPQQPGLLGGAPTTTQDVNGTIQGPSPAAPPSPAMPLANRPSVQGPQPQGPQPVVAPAGQQQPVQPHPMARIFDGILKTMSGGPVVINDPVTGQRRELPQSRTTMGRNIVAGALAGLFSKTEYIDTPYGKRPDTLGTLGNAYQAGQGVAQARQAAAQKLTDDQQARKLATIQGNAHQVQMSSALAQEQHKSLMDVVDANQKKYMPTLTAYDDQRDPQEKSIFAAQGKTSDEVLSSGHRLTDHDVFIDGFTSKRNALGVMEDEPTYAIIRTTNADGSPLKLKLSEGATKELGKFNRSYEDIYSKTGGEVLVGVTQYLNAVRTANTLTHAEDFLQRAQSEIDPKATPIDLAAAYKKDPVKMWKSINTLEAALAGGQSRGENGGSTDNVIRTMRAQAGGDQLLNLLGTPQQVDAWAEKQRLGRMEEEAHAKGASKEDIAQMNLDAKEKAAENKETAKQKSLMGYAEDADGRLQYVSKYDVDNNPDKYSGQTFSEMKPSEVAKDRALVKPLGDVQMNLNHYRSAVNTYDAAVKAGRVNAASDKKNLQTILSAPEIINAAEAHAGAGGIGVSIPTLTADLNASLAKKVTDAYNGMSPEGRAMADNYARARAAIPAWVKALTNSGRGSKEQLEIELQNLLPPYYNMSDIHNRLDGFQDNLDNQKTSIPQNLLGQRMPVPVARTGQAPQTVQPAQSNAPNQPNAPNAPNAPNTQPNAGVDPAAQFGGRTRR